MSPTRPRPTPTSGRPFARSSGRAAALAALAGALALPAVGGCAAGQRAETSLEHSTVDPVGASAGLMQVRALYVVGPADKGGQAQVHMTLVNGGTTPDSLVAGSSVDAAGLTVQGGGAATGSAYGNSPAAVSSGGGAGSGVTVAAGALVPLQGGGAGTVLLTGLKQALTPGSSVQLTLRFRNGGSVSIPAVPVEGPTGAGSTPVPPTPLSSAPPGSPTGGSPTPSVAVSSGGTTG